MTKEELIQKHLTRMREIDKQSLAYTSAIALWNTKNIITNGNNHLIVKKNLKLTEEQIDKFIDQLLPKESK